MPERLFDPQSLAVDPAWMGRALPSPGRRATAFAIDALLLLVPTLVTALIFSGLSLRTTDPAGYAAVKAAIFAMPQEPAAQHAVMRDLARVLVRIDAPGLPTAVKADVEAGELDRAAERLTTIELLVALDLGGDAPPPAAPNVVRLDLQALIPAAVRTAALFIVPAVYFAFATARWGTTLGKRLLGLRVVRLDGRKLSLFEGVERFGAYFGLLGTLGLGLFDLWRDPNRRLGHDRAVDTVVLRSAPLRATAPPPSRIESAAEAP
jgi:uncharacterized RDD family membrane protein YckC